MVLRRVAAPVRAGAAELRCRCRCQFSTSTTSSSSSTSATATATASEPRHQAEPWAKPQWPTGDMLRQLHELIAWRDSDPAQRADIAHWPTVVESSAPGGGLGVVATCRDPHRPIPPGTLICCYPGLVRLHPPVMLDAWGEQEPVTLPPLGLTSAGHTYTLNTGSYTVDGAPETAVRSYGDHPLEQMRWACGHRINHPPRSHPHINVTPIPAYAAPLAAEGDPMVCSEVAASTVHLTEQLMQWVPSRWAADWRYETVHDGQRSLLPRQAPVPVLMMVTCAEVFSGEELHYDYQLVDDGTYPWYFRVLTPPP